MMTFLHYIVIGNLLLHAESGGLFYQDRPFHADQWERLVASGSAVSLVSLFEFLNLNFKTFR
jgi:hypothetical protein